MKLTQNAYILRALQVHGTYYDYSNVVYNGMHAYIEIGCPMHGPFKQLAGNHLKYGCKYCGGTANLTQVEFITRAEEKHNNFYDYSVTKFINMATYIELICPIHGLFTQLPPNHLRYGCKKCSYEKRGKNQRLPIENFVKRSNIIHNHRYSYLLVNYINAHTEITILCPIHGEFVRTPDKHLQGCGCPKCFATTSKPEIEWLESFDLNMELQKRIYLPDNTYVRVDGYDPITNTIYEFNGNFWHGNPTQCDPDEQHPFGETFGDRYINTLVRENRLKEMGYKLVTKWA